ncbi:spore germination protein [Clostridium polyendosporum]|uniref:Spore germination protein n=1 Tax=Clostridium polyendosporum TaxID=69208 RepID=A0A919RW89_9CLOT|nr:spore germination protein [Clostridium polyendosporum]GIM27627.1 spore germination protein [Clostridium polyendosporum]
MLDLIKTMFSLSDENSKKKTINETAKVPKDENIKISHILEENKQYIKNIFENCSDLIIRELKITNNPEFSAMLVYIDNMIQTNLIEQSIIEKLTKENQEKTYTPNSKDYSKYLLGIRDNDIYIDMDKIIDSILSGKLILFIDKVNEALVINVNNPPGRNIEEPEVESVIRGPREGFTESIATNKVLIRKKIKNTNLKMESMKIGRETKTDIAIAYLSNIANHDIVREVRKRLNKIDIDAVLGASYIKEYIEDDPTSGFPTIFSTEKPDVVAGKLLEGRIAIIIDGTPVVIIMPSLFIEFMITNEDFYLKFIPSTINRWIRYLSFIICLTLPGTYVAITTFHQEFIPTPLLVTFIKARSGVPYPALFECFLMLLAYEILREAGVRIPRAVGQAISVVGAVVLGQAAVEAGLASTPMVIVIAATAISSFAIPSTDMYTATTFPRFIFLLLGGTLGLLGVTSGAILLFIKLISMRSFGVPYMAPLAPVVTNELPDLFMRRPLWAKFKRSWLITGTHSIRRKPKSRIKSIKEEHKKAMEENNRKE